MKCPNCHTELPSGAMFCRNCGCRLPLECPGCHENIAADAKFCKYCGTDIAGFFWKAWVDEWRAKYLGSSFMFGNDSIPKEADKLEDFSLFWKVWVDEWRAKYLGSPFMFGNDSIPKEADKLEEFSLLATASNLSGPASLKWKPDKAEAGRIADLFRRYCAERGYTWEKDF